LGLDAQRQAVHEYVRNACGEIVHEYVEVESGSKRNRPILVQSIAHCKKEGAILVLARLDRLARNVAFVSALMETGVEFVAVDAPFANKLLVHILAAFAEHERGLISERTKAALAAARARGVELGKNGRVLAAGHKIEAQHFAETLRPEIVAAVASGARTLAQIADKLELLGHRTREGARHSPGSVHRIIKRLQIDRCEHV
jgi:DNA invertase Pin-like site-specific DNA recombinase